MANKKKDEAARSVSPSNVENKPPVAGGQEIAIAPEIVDALESINKLPPGERELLIQAINSESFSGPLPHPSILQGYEGVKEGFAERIVKMAEKEQDARLESERAMVNGTICANKRGQWMGFIIAILFLAGSIALGIIGQPVLAGIIGGGTLVALVTVFVTNRPSSNNNDKPEE